MTGRFRNAAPVTEGVASPRAAHTPLLLRARHYVKDLSTVSSLQVAIILIFIATALYLVTSPRFPAVRLPLFTTPDWTSWFDVAITYPILVVCCIVVLQRESLREVLAATAVVIFIPMYHEIESYLVYYSVQTSLASDVLYLSFAGISSVIALSLRAQVAGPSSKPLLSTSRTQYLWLAAVLSVGLAWIQIGLRLSTHPTHLTDWVSDIGITAEAGARDLLHGINPYRARLPPWGGPASLLYGPVGFGLLSPFALLPRGWGALVGSSFFAIITALGVRKCVTYWRPSVGTGAGLLFLALPTTSWAIEAGLVTYLIAAATIVWAIAFYVRGHFGISSFVVFLGCLTIVVPAILLLPMLLYSSRKAAVRLVAGFAAPMALGLAAVVGLVGPELVVTKVKELLYFGSTFGFYASFGGDLGEILALLVLGFVIELAVVTRLTTGSHDRGAVLALSAEMLVLIPLVVGSNFPAVFIMASCIIVVLLTLGHPLGGPESDGIDRRSVHASNGRPNSVGV